MSTKKGKAVPLDREIPDGTAVISIVHPEGNPSGVTVEETVIKDNTTQRSDIGTNVGEALEKALQKRESKSKSSKTKTNHKKENQKMKESAKTNTVNATKTVNNEAKAQPKVEQKSEAAPATPAQPAAAEAKPQQISDLIAELKTIKGELSNPTKLEVEHHRSLDTGAEAKHQFLVGLATGAGVALGVTVITTAAWLIQRKLSGGNDSSAE